MPKKIHFNWKTNVSEINNWVFLGSSREIAVLGISSPICGFHPGHETLSFAQFLKFQSTEQKKKVEDATLVYIKKPWYKSYLKKKNMKLNSQKIVEISRQSF